MPYSSSSGRGQVMQEKLDVASLASAAGHCSRETQCYIRSQRQCCGLSED